MDQVPAVVSEDVRTEEQSSIDVAPSTAVDVSSAKSEAPPSEDIADSDRPASSQGRNLVIGQINQKSKTKTNNVLYRDPHSYYSTWEVCA